MSFPVAAAISGGIGLANALFGGDEEDFQFHPDQNDPLLALLRRRALFDSQRDYSRTTDDIARAGLTGSSAGFAQLNEQSNRRARTLEDIDAQVFAMQRADQLAEHQRKGQNSAQQRLGGLGAIGDIGSFVGEQIPSLGNSGQDYATYLDHVPNNLPKAALQSASQYAPTNAIYPDNEEEAWKRMQPKYTRGRYL